MVACVLVASDVRAGDPGSIDAAQVRLSRRGDHLDPTSRKAPHAVVRGPLMGELLDAFYQAALGLPGIGGRQTQPQARLVDGSGLRDHP